MAICLITGERPARSSCSVHSPFWCLSGLSLCSAEFSHSIHLHLLPSKLKLSPFDIGEQVALVKGSGEKSRKCFEACQPDNFRTGLVCGEYAIGQKRRHCLDLVTQYVQNFLGFLPLVRCEIVVAKQQIGNDKAGGSEYKPAQNCPWFLFATP